MSNCPIPSRNASASGLKVQTSVSQMSSYSELTSLLDDFPLAPPDAPSLKSVAKFGDDDLWLPEESTHPESPASIDITEQSTTCASLTKENLSIHQKELNFPVIGLPSWESALYASSCSSSLSSSAEDKEDDPIEDDDDDERLTFSDGDLEEIREIVEVVRPAYEDVLGLGIPANGKGHLVWNGMGLCIDGMSPAQRAREEVAFAGLSQDARKEIRAMYDWESRFRMIPEEPVAPLGRAQSMF